MKRIGVVLLLGTGFIVMWASNRSQAQDPGGGVLKNPFADPTPMVQPMNPGVQLPMRPGTSVPSSAQQLFGSGANQAPSPFPDPAMRDPYLLVLEKLKPNPNLALNRDIEVTPQVGPWLVQLTYYQGPEAPQMAREMVSYLRSDAYKLPAYVFNHGTEEKRKEYERVQREHEKHKEMVAKQRDALKGQDIIFGSTRVPYVRVEEQVAVVVGGYRDEAAAKRALDQMRNLKPPDPSKVKLAMIFGGERDLKDPKNLKIDKAEVKYLSPFRTAWVARNPTIKSDQPQERDGLELDALKKFNAGEPFSLLQCKKPYTLVVKIVQVPTVIQGRNERTSTLEITGVLKNGDRVDAAAQSAHSLCELLRKAKYESYVLHTKFSSMVTIGQFDGVDDPNLRSMQSLLVERLRVDTDRGDVVKFLPQPVPMEVPGVRVAAAARVN
jgi:hypothetical protein